MDMESELPGEVLSAGLCDRNFLEFVSHGNANVLTKEKKTLC
jgi:hypothetical protein